VASGLVANRPVVLQPNGFIDISAEL